MQTQRISVTGMTCQGCVESVTRALHAVNGVRNADVALASGSATIQFDEHQTSVDELEQVVQRAGYEVSKGGSSETVQPKHKGCCCGE